MRRDGTGMVELLMEDGYTEEEAWKIVEKEQLVDSNVNK
jgi:hypothetical protein